MAQVSDVKNGHMANGHGDDYKKKNKRGNKGGYKGNKGGKRGGHKGGKRKGGKGRNGGSKFNKTDKIKFRINKMISKTQLLAEKKNNELDLLQIQEKQLNDLLNDVDNLDINTIKMKIKNIVKSYKIKKNKKLRKKKNNKKWDKQNRKKRNSKKNDDKENKLKEKKLKFEEKEERKYQRKLKKEERKRLKEEKLKKFESARLETLPLNCGEIGNYKLLNIYVDGYNIIGCDSLCRKSMRGRGGGMKKARKRLIHLIQNNFLNDLLNKKLNLPYSIKVFVWFDGNGKNYNDGDIEITFSTKKQIVDDKLVEKFSKNSISLNSNNLVITSDKELTLRLYEIGVKVIKSSVFYKKYLKEQKNEINKKENDDSKINENENDELKYETPEGTADSVGGTAEDAVFIKYCTQKMTSTSDDDEEGDANDDDEDYPGKYDGEETPDDMTDSDDYSFCNDDDDDDDFDETFADDLDNDDHQTYI